MSKTEPLPVTTWGDWLRRRMLYVGIKSQTNFARYIGCRPEHVSRWVNMEVAPLYMRKGFDRAMAMALKVRHATLFIEWASVTPEAAPIVTDAGIVLPREEAALRRKIVAVVELLPAEKLKPFFEAGESLLHSNVA